MGAPGVATSAAEPPDPQEAVWVARAAAGDRQAFAELLRLHQGYLRQFLRRLCRGDAARADDLAQDAFLDAWRGLPGFRAEARFRSWLTRLALSAYSRDKARRDHAPLDRQAAAPAGADTDADTPGPDDDLPVADFAPGVADRLDLDRALARLRDTEREAVMLCWAADCSHAEAAQWLGCPVGTVKSLLLRARPKLQALLGGDTGASP